MIQLKQLKRYIGSVVHVIAADAFPNIQIHYYGYFSKIERRNIIVLKTVEGEARISINRVLQVDTLNGELE